MNWIGKLFNLFSGSGNYTTPEWWNGMKVTENYLHINTPIGINTAFLSVPAIAYVIQKIENGFLNGEFYVEKKNGEFNENSPLLTFFETNFLKQFVKEIILHKQCVIRPKYKSLGSPIVVEKIEILPFEKISPYVENFQIVDYLYSAENEKIPFSDVIHIFSSQPVFSESKYTVENELYSIEQAVNSLLSAYRVRNTAQQQKGGLFILSKNMPKDSVVEINTREISEEGEKKLQKDLEKYGNERDKYAHLITNVDYKVTPMVFPINSMMLTEGIENAIKDIARAFVIPIPYLLDSSSTYNNMKTIEKQLYTDIVKPLWNIFSKFVNQLFQLRNETFKIDSSGVEALQADKKLELETKNIEVQTIINLNTQVYNGLMKRETALFILQDTYNYSEENAEKLIIKHNGKEKERTDNTNSTPF